MDRTCETCEYYGVWGGYPLCYWDNYWVLDSYNAGCEEHQPREGEANGD